MTAKGRGARWRPGASAGPDSVGRAGARSREARRLGSAGGSGGGSGTPFRAGIPEDPPRDRAPVILVAEDSPTQAAWIAATLEAAGFATRVAHDGEAALGEVLAGGVDVVLTDVEMPRLDGFELCRRLKDDPSRRHLPVVVLTQRDRITDIIRALEVGADNYLTKPLTAEELVGRIGRLVDEVSRWRDRSRERRHRVASGAEELVLTFERAQVVEMLMGAAEKLEGELATLGEIGLGLTMDHDLDDVLEAFAQRTRQLAEAAAVAIAVAEGNERLRVQAVDGGPDVLHRWLRHVVRPAWLGLEGHHLARREPLEVALTERPAGRLLQRIAAATGFRQALLVPLVVNERPTGLLVLFFGRARRFAGNELRRYRTLGDQAAVAIENARLFGRERELRQRIERLYRATGDLGLRLGPAAASQRAVEVAREAMGTEYAALSLWDETGRLTGFFTAGIAPEVAAAVAHPPVGAGILRQPLERGAVLDVPNVAADPRTAGWPPSHPAITDLLLTPIFAGRLRIGELYVANTGGRGFSDEDRRILPILAEQVGMLLENLALFDELTRARAAEAELGRLLDASASEVFVVDPESLRIRRMNARARRNLGYEGIPADELSVVDIEAPEAAERSFRAHLAALGSRDRGEVECDLLLRRRDGTTYPAEGRLRLVAEETPPVVVAVVHDVTERRHLEAQLLHAQRMESIGRLAGGIAHDFNNFLTAIAGHAQLLLFDLDPDDPRRADAQAIADAARRAAGLTAQLLAFGRRQVLQPQTISLNDVVRETEPLLRRLIGEGIDLVIRLAEDLGAVRADPGQIQQVLMNLCLNARDAMPGGGCLTIETANVELDERYAMEHVDARPGPHVVLAVSDTGLGMAADVMAHLFEPFFTTKERGRGTGLGLATSYGIARQSGGHITAYSAPGRGSTFKVYLPRVDAPAQPIRADADSATVRGGTETILVVEDEAAVRELVVGVLERAGYTVLAAPDGPGALELAAGPAKVDLVVSDLVLPGMDGVALVRRLRSKAPTLAVLFISGYSEALVHGRAEDGPPADRPDATRAGEAATAGPTAPGEGAAVGGVAGAAFLGKPFGPQALLAAVRRVLDASTGSSAGDA